VIVGAHQPSFLPWLGYLDKVAKSDVFVVMDDLQYEAQNFQNRQRVKINSGATWLTVPLAHGSQSDRICDKRIDNGATGKHSWTHRHWQTLETHYRRAPYFAKYADEVRDIYSRTWTSLLELDMRMLDLARTWLGIKVPIIRSSGLALQGQKTDRLVDMCKKVGARAYLSGGGGSHSYLDVEQFGRAGVGVIWQHFEHPRYPQRYGSFVSHLGFFDLVFNVGPNAHAALFDRMHPLEVWR